MRPFMAREIKNIKQKRNRIILVDDHPIVRRGLKELIEEENDMEVCGEADDTKTGWELIKKLKPDLAIVDIFFKEADDLEFIRGITKRRPDFPVLVVSMYNENIYAERALRAGAKGYIMKEQATEKVIEGIRQVLNGEVYISENLSKHIISKIYGSGTEPGEDSSPINILSDRELEVFKFIGKGFTIKEIGQRLNLSMKTIETYRKTMRKKLDISGIPELNKYAIFWTNNMQL